jgi:hypothetical protein
MTVCLHQSWDSTRSLRFSCIRWIAIAIAPTPTAVAPTLDGTVTNFTCGEDAWDTRFEETEGQRASGGMIRRPPTPFDQEHSLRRRLQIVAGDEKIHTGGPGERLRRDEQSHLLSPVREFGEPRRRRPCRLLTEH